MLVICLLILVCNRISANLVSFLQLTMVGEWPSSNSKPLPEGVEFSYLVEFRCGSVTGGPNCARLFSSATRSAWVLSKDNMAQSMADQWQNTERGRGVTVVSHWELGVLCYSSIPETVLTDTFTYKESGKLHFYTTDLCAFLEVNYLQGEDPFWNPARKS